LIARYSSEFFYYSRSAGAAVAGAAAGTRTAAGAGNCLGYTTEAGTEGGEGRHLAPGGFMAPGAVRRFS